ncbi:anthocyanidin 3-O-glucosyltransferase 2-like [Malania oleifera]|uniref:anthocyanidin 3-O-glucosyltransferase 2-like n=1 Tax=Malania oleifera TaxID=397392 RepID=UPI0025AEB67D|nr:anthocyanidin 3-O-glucosyltransferase 2-like [Malania oleifera]
MKKVELIFIPFPVMGHIISAVEIANLLSSRYNHRLSITILLMDLPFDSMATAYTRSLSSDVEGSVKFVNLPPPQQTPPELSSLKSPHTFLQTTVDAQIPNVRAAIVELTQSLDSGPLAGLVLDMNCSATMIDLAHEMHVPSYVFFTSGAAFLGLLFHLQSLHDDHCADVTEFLDSNAELVVPCFANPVPSRVLPHAILNKEGWYAMTLNFARSLRKSKGILVNTCAELESYAINSLNSSTIKIPPIYPVGPLLNRTNDDQKESSIISWLDDQPPSSVVFLCFGSMGSFSVDQVREIARGLEHSGQRFIWSLRRSQPSTNGITYPTSCANLEELLPEGFLERTVGIGKIIGWAPQVAVLAHKAVGGFMSHCGWNSILESVWWGVPVATWPMYAEQHLNAFEMLKELGLGVEIIMDYKRDGHEGDLVSAKQIEMGIRGVMEGDGEMRKKVKDMSEKAQEAIMEGGSSHTSLGHFVEQVMCNMDTKSN